jgi:hypothetical protein
MKKRTKMWGVKIIYSFTTVMMVLQPVSSPGILKAMAADEPAAVAAAETVSAPKEEPKVEAPVDTSEIVENNEETAQESQDSTATDSATNVETSENDTPTLADQPVDGAITPEAAAVEIPTEEATTEAPKEEVKKDIWSTDGDKATTNDPVEKDVTYVAPQNKDVTVTFTKLPDKPGTLSIEEITLTKEQQETLGSVSDKAYDITSTMENGTFEYNLTLPKTGNEDASISYIEKSAYELDGISLDEVKKIDKDNTKVKDGAIEATAINHFTVYFVQSYSNNTYITVKDSYSQGETVYGKATRDTAANMRLRYRNPSDTVVATCAYSNATVVYCDYALPADAPTGEWDIQIGRCDNSCSSSSNWIWTGYGEDHFTVVASCGSTTTYTKSSDFADSLVDINFSSSNYVISVSAGSGYAVTKVELDVDNDGYGGYHTYATGPLTNFNPNPGNQITSARVEVTRVCTPPSNTPPVAVNDSYSTNQNTPLTVSAALGVLANDTDADGDSIHTIMGTVPAHGTLNNSNNVAPDGSFIYTPDTDYVGTDSFTYLADDGEDNGNTATVTINVIDNIAPTGGSITYADGFYTATSVPITYIIGTDSGSGLNLASGKIQRASANLSGTTCGSFGSFSDRVTEHDGAYTDTVSFGHCYKYRYSIADNNGNVAIYTSANIAKIAQPGSIEAYKFNDRNGNGSRNSGEEYLSGWQMNLYGGQNCGGTPIAQGTTAGSSGRYTFNNLTPNQWYSVNETEDRPDWTRTTAACQNTYISDDDTDSVYFGNRQLGSIRVCKIITDGKGNIVDGSAVPATTFTINWSNGLAPTVFQSGYTPNTKILDSSEGNDAYCIDYPNLPIDNYQYSQEQISDDSIWETPKYNDQFVSSVNSLDDFYNYNSNEDSNGDINLALSAGPNRTLVILNQYQIGSITVHKFNDLNDNGINDDEPVISGRTIGVYAGSDCSGQVIFNGMQTTDGNGEALFPNLMPGDYSVKEENMPTDWINTTEECQSVTVSAGQNVDVNVGNFQLGSVMGCKYNDLDGNGIRANKVGEGDEPQMSGWTIRLYNSNWKKIGETVTNPYYNFNNVMSKGTYYLCEQMQDGWMQTEPTTGENYGYTAVQNQSGDQTEGALCKQVEVDRSNFYGSHYYSFGNRQVGMITIKKETENKDNGRAFNFSTSYSNDFTLHKDESNSQYLVPGTYTLNEHDEQDWNLIAVSCHDLDGDSNIDQHGKDVTVDLVAGGNVVCTYTNKKESNNNNGGGGGGNGGNPTPGPFGFFTPTGGGVVSGETTTEPTGGQISQGEENKPGEVQGEATTQGECIPISWYVFALVLIIYILIMLYNLFYKLKESEGIRWFWEIFWTLAGLVIWYFFDRCRTNMWFVYASIILGFILYLIYFGLIKRRHLPESSK